jgi:hypothetical protein
MEHYAGIDVSLESASVCVVDATGRIARETKVASEPEVLTAWFRGLGISLSRIGLEAGPLSQWLYAGMREAGLPVELLETRHVRAAFKAMPVKTDRKDARGIAQLMRLGWFRPVHCKSLPAQETRALLTARKLVQSKRHDLEMSVRGILRGFGLKVGATTPRTFEGRVRELVGGHPTLLTVMEALLTARAALGEQLQRLEKRVRSLARDDQRARLLMSAPGGWSDRCADLCRSDRRSRTVSILQERGCAFWPHAEEVSIRRNRRHRADLEDRRCRRAYGPIRGRQRHPDPAGEGLVAQELGGTPGGARGHAKGQGGIGPQARGRVAQNAG